MSDEEELDPNAPWSPEEGTEELTTEQLLEIQQSLPLLKAVIDWFDEQIALYKDPTIIEGANPSSKAEDLKEAILLAQGFIKGYKYKRNEFAVRFKKLSAIVAPPKE